jgi:HlyD family secretion protein
LKAGNAAEIKVSGVEEPIEGKVTLVSPALDPGSTTLEVWVEAHKPNLALRPGITVQVEMTAKTDKNALVVPAAAVFKNPDGGGDYVLVAGTDDKAHLKTVHVGIHAADSAEIISGIKEGDSVITTGGYAVADGTKIKIEKPEAPEKEEAAGDKKGASAKPDDKDKE